MVQVQEHQVSGLWLAQESLLQGKLTCSAWLQGQLRLLQADKLLADWVLCTEVLRGSDAQVVQGTGAPGVWAASFAAGCTVVRGTGVAGTPAAAGTAVQGGAAGVGGTGAAGTGAAAWAAVGRRVAGAARAADVFGVTARAGAAAFAAATTGTGAVAVHGGAAEVNGTGRAGVAGGAAGWAAAGTAAAVAREPNVFGVAAGAWAATFAAGYEGTGAVAVHGCAAGVKGTARAGAAGGAAGCAALGTAARSDVFGVAAKTKELPCTDTARTGVVSGTTGLAAAGVVQDV